MLGAARLLVERGHTVDVLAPRLLRERAANVGAGWLAAPPAAELDPARGRALEDQPDFVREVQVGPVVAGAVLGIGRARAYDVLVVDHFLSSTLAAARATGLPTVAFAHTAYRFHGAAGSGGQTLARARLAATCASLGVEAPVPTGESIAVESMRDADLVLVPMTREFDPRPVLPANVVHSGPLFEEAESALSWDDPWLRAQEGPIIVVSLSSQYVHQEEALQRILDALSSLAVRVVVTTGFELAPDELELPASALVRAYVPHRALLPHAALVVTHGGMGTIMAAFACGIPLVCLPLGRDQPGNASRVAALGAGVALRQDADERAIARAVSGALTSVTLRAGAARMRASVASYGGGRRAVEALEGLAAGTTRTKVQGRPP
jgi:MGT family glycosyltransferase